MQKTLLWIQIILGALSLLADITLPPSEQYVKKTIPKIFAVGFLTQTKKRR
jgi:hypothetical protein